MSEYESKFELPKNIERYLAALSKLYAQEGQKQLEEIIVNSQVRVHEECSYDNWNGGTYGHALYLSIPEVLYPNHFRRKDEIQEKITQDINKIHNIQNEFIAEVFLEMEITEGSDWRKDSGLFLTSKRIVLPDAVSRIWGNEGYRVFFCHKAEVKKETAGLKEKLDLFGISCFVAHEDINPTQEWQGEIENALSSMDALVALMTEGFHDSPWTDQEVGFAFGREVPIISVKLGMDPYGFIGKFQALSCSWDTAHKENVKLLVKYDRMLNAYIKAIQNCGSFDNGNTLSEILPSIENLSKPQAEKMVSAFNENPNAQGSYGLRGNWPRKFGNGLPFHLNRLTGRAYRLTTSGKIEVTP